MDGSLPPRQSRRPKPALGRAFIDDAGVQEALDYLLRTAEMLAGMVLEEEVAEKSIPIALAEAMQQSSHTSEWRCKAEALVSPSYLRAVERHAKAKSNLEGHRAFRRGYELRIEAWRSIQANIRAMKV